MISKFTPEFDLTEPTNGSMSEQYIITNVNFKDKIRVHIPKFIPGLPAGKPITRNFPLSNSIFANKNKSRPVFSNMVLKEQNFLTGTFNNEHDSLLKIAQVKEIKMSSSDDEEEEDEEETRKVGIIPQGAKLRCSFLNGKISKLNLEIDTIDQSYVTAEALGYERIEDLVPTTRPASMVLYDEKGKASYYTADITTQDVRNATKGGGVS